MDKDVPGALAATSGSLLGNSRGHYAFAYSQIPQPQVPRFGCCAFGGAGAAVAVEH